MQGTAHGLPLTGKFALTGAFRDRSNLFMTGSHVGHDCVIGSHCVFANYATLGGHV